MNFAKTPVDQLHDGDQVTNPEGMTGYVFKHPFSWVLYVAWDSGSDQIISEGDPIMKVEE